MVKKLGFAALLLVVSASASPKDWKKCHKDMDRDDKDKKVLCAPEVDPTAAFAGLALAIGGLAVLRGRRVKPTAS